MIGSRSTILLRHGLRSVSLAALMSFASFGYAQSTATAQHTAPDAQMPSIATCVACHGALGAGTATGGPRLAGKNPDYLAHALSMFKAGTRSSAVMQAVAHNLSDSDMRELAEFFSKQHPPLAAGAQPPSQALVVAGKELAEMGAGSDIPACFSCHAAGGKGNGARFPSIAGQPAARAAEPRGAWIEHTGDAPRPAEIGSTAPERSVGPADESRKRTLPM